MTEKKVLDAKDAQIKRGLLIAPQSNYLKILILLCFAETLMLRKIELEKRLNEKYNQLQALSEQVSFFFELPNKHSLSLFPSNHRCHAQM
jgi:hypothetical protein